MSLPRLAVHRPVTTAMLLISVLVIGGIAAFRLPLAYLPEIDVPFIGVQIPYPNSNPLQIEREIAKPVEEVLATLPGVKKLNSTSDADGAQFFLEFDWGNELDIVRMLVSEKMDQVKQDLPAGIGEIVIFSFNTSDIPVVQGRISAQGVDLASNYELIEARVLNRLRRVPGVARVTLEGVEPREIFIDLVLDKVKAHAVDVGALIQRLQGASSNLVLGQVDDSGMRFTARAVGEFLSVDQIRDIRIDDRGLRLSDIAEVSYEQPPIGYGRHLDRSYAVALEVYKESTANTVDVVESVFHVLHDDIDKDPLLQGVNVFVWEDQGEIITNGIRGLLMAGLVGSLLAVFSLYFFLRRFDSTFIVSLSIPFSVIAACGLIYFMGGNLNILSMMGLMLAVGMLVDNAVVVLESIDRRHRTEKDRNKAALEGARQVSVAVATSTLTTVIVFLPLLVGAKTDLATWLREIGVSITIALGCSLFTSLTLIPLMAAHVLGRRRSKPIAAVERMEERYVRILRWTLRHRVATALLLVFTLIVGLAPFMTGMVEAAMFSGTRNERLFLRYDFADFTYKSDAERAVDRIEGFLDSKKAEYGIESLYSYYAENRAETTMTLARKNLNDDEARDLRQRIREDLPVLPGVRFLFDDDSDSGGSSTFFAVKFFGQDTGILEGFATEASRRLETVEGIQDVRTPFKEAQREIQVRIDREKATRLGLTAQDMADIFSFTLGSMRLPRFNAGEREVDTWLGLRLEDRQNLEDLKAIQIGGRDGRAPILLGDIATFEVVPRPKEIVRENRKVRIEVTGTYEGDDWEAAKGEIEGLMNAFEMPPGYSWGWNDRIIEQEGHSQQMAINMLLALMLVYIVMASLFESLAQPFAILVSILFALPGVAWALAITGTKFNLMAQIGIMILMGIVVNNGIVLLDQINRLRGEGLERDEAIFRAGRERLRPILMTAVTTIIGLLPLAVRGPNAAGLFYFPLARTVMGGLTSSSILTLLALPYFMILVETVAGWFRRIWRTSRPRRVAVGAVAERPSS
ncbi:MAG: efflux RND transporter permease subunit [Thermoanaerobaculia bacterium]